jgi:hypothetical protein
LFMRSMSRFMMNCLSLSCALRIRSARDVNDDGGSVRRIKRVWIQEPYYVFSQLI